MTVTSTEHNFFDPVSFWLHIPGGGLFGIIFGFVIIHGLWKIWGPKRISNEI